MHEYTQMNTYLVGQTQFRSRPRSTQDHKHTGDGDGQNDYFAHSLDLGEMHTNIEIPYSV